VATERDGGIFFCPSRFAGYRGNTRAKHENNDHKDGKETNPTISEILWCKPSENADLEAAYSQFCNRIGVEYRDLEDKKIRRKYWILEGRA